MSGDKGYHISSEGGLAGLVGEGSKYRLLLYDIGENWGKWIRLEWNKKHSSIFMN
jgi:hypothetical protein